MTKRKREEIMVKYDPKLIPQVVAMTTRALNDERYANNLPSIRTDEVQPLLQP